MAWRKSDYIPLSSGNNTLLHSCLPIHRILLNRALAPFQPIFLIAYTPKIPQKKLLISGIAGIPVSE
jgi:hypothetical protein